MKPRILIVDDETDFCLIMKNFFTKKGYEVNLAFTLQDGLKKVTESSPQILFMDNNLPDGNGWDAVEGIVEKIPQIRAYLVSAHRNKSSFLKKDDKIVIWEKPISLSALNEVFETVPAGSDNTNG
jgi:DNA-binding NtrC family response regulator